MSSTSSFFLGPRHGRWAPGTWAELAEAVSNGVLNETSWVELKAGLPPNQQGATELGRDLASLALRSGLLVVGVSEASRGVAGQLRGVDLAESRDRVDQIARNVPSPPIYVETREIPDPDLPARGVLLVGVPASGPHMVDGRYWGRGDTGKTVLSDAEVREHLTRRQVAEDDILTQVRKLEETTARDEGGGRPLPRLFLRAVPTSARNDGLLPLLEQHNGNHRIQEHVAEAARRRPGPSEQSELANAHWWGRFARGRVLTSIDPTMTADQNGITLRLEEGGAVDLAYRTVGSQSSRMWGEGTVATIHTGLVLSVVHDTLGVVGRISDQHGAYQGSWIVAVRIDALEGFQDWRLTTRGITHFPPAYVGAPEYEATTTTTTGELVERPWAVANRLLGRLVRALGAERIYLPYEPGSQAAALVTSA